MFIPWYILSIILALYVYLIVTDMHLHRRVRRLEEIIENLEGSKKGSEFDARTEDFGG